MHKPLCSEVWNPEVWKNATPPAEKNPAGKSNEEVTSSAQCQTKGGEYGCLPYILQCLIMPAWKMRTYWASTMFAAVALVGPDIRPEPATQPPLPAASDLEFDLKCIECFLEFSSFKKFGKRPVAGLPSNSDTLQQIDDGSTKVDLKPLTNLVTTVYDILVNYAMIQAHCKITSKHKEGSTEKELVQQENGIKMRLETFKKKHQLNRMCYSAITGFMVSGVRGLFFLPSNHQKIQINGCLQLLTLSAKLVDLKEMVVKDPIWKRTNNLICSILELAFLKKHSFYEVQVNRYEVAKALALDFGDFWASNNKNEAERYLVVLPRTVKMVSQFEGVEEEGDKS